MHPETNKEEVTKKSKPEMCKAINALGLIDDSEHYITQCAAELESFHGLVFGEYGWNQKSINLSSKEGLNEKTKNGHMMFSKFDSEKNTESK